MNENKPTTPLLMLLAVSVLWISHLIMLPKMEVLVSALPSARTQVAALEGSGSGLVGLWKFDEGSGTNATDFSGSGNNGILMGGVTWSSGKIGSGSVNFNGTSGYVDAGNPASLSFGTGSFTMSLWVKGNPTQSDANFGAIINKSVGDLSDDASVATGWMLAWYKPQSQYFFYLKDGTQNRSDIYAFGDYLKNDDTWRHVAISVSQDAIQGYVNGLSTGNAVARGKTGSINTSASLNIGRWREFSRYWNGSADDVRVYNRALTASEVAEIYNSSSGVSQPVATPPPLISDTSPGSYWITGFYSADNGRQSVANIPWSKYTHVNHFAAATGPNGTVLLNYIPQSEIAPFVSAAHAAGKKALVTIIAKGTSFADATNASNIANFVSNIKNLVVNNGYDGVDIDWEDETTLVLSQYLDLITRLRTALGPNKLIAVDVHGGIATAAAQSQAYLNQINVMCYDMDYQSYTWHNDALFQNGDSSKTTCDWRVRALTNSGVAKSKIGIGIPFYGRRWTGTSAPLQTSGTKQPEWVNYYDLASDSTRFTDAYKKWDSKYYADYISDTGRNEFTSYNGLRFIHEAVVWGKSQGFGGFMSFTTDYEYIPTKSGDERYPLSTALYNEVMGIASPVATPVAPAPSAVNGSCSTTLNTCTAGAFSDVTDTSTNRLWSCVGSNGGSTASCSLPITLLPDATPPTVSITSPLNGSTVSGSNVSIGASASDPATAGQATSLIASVQFKLDGIAIAPTFTTAPYSGTWNTVGMTNGQHTLTAVATDSAGNSRTSSSVIVTVFNQSVPPDSDKDGVADSADKCAGTLVTLASSVNALGCPKPKATKFTITPDTSTADITSVQALEISNVHAKISYTSTAAPLTLVKDKGSYKDQMDIDSNLTLSNGLASLNATNLFELNKPATITFYNINLVNPVILKDGILCVGCSVVSYSGGTFVFKVPGFSTYTVVADSGTTIPTPAPAGGSSNPTPTPVPTPIPTPIPTPAPASSSGGGGGSSSSGSSSGGSSSSVSTMTGVITPTVPQSQPVAPICQSTAVFARSLVQGSTGSDVLQLQKFLNSQGFTVSTSGAGSKGLETTYFGPATKIALTKFQKAYGIVETSGYFGPLTLAKANSLKGSQSCSVSNAPITQVASQLIGGNATGQTPANRSPFTRSLQIGSVGSDVKNLQIFLNSQGFLVSSTGPGSKGLESTYFGPATYKALIKFQEKYSSEILTPNGLTKGTGYFGVSTMRKVNGGW